MKIILLAFTALIINSLPVQAEDKFKCFHEFHNCNVQNLGMKFCMEKRKMCEANKRAGVKTDITPPSRNTPQRNPRMEQRLNQNPLFNKAPKQPTPPSTDSAVIQSVPQSQKQTGECFVISMSQKACVEPASGKCKVLSNAFVEKSDCNACLTRYRLPMERHNLTIFMTVQKLKSCKPYKRDLVKLAECQRTLANNDEKSATLAYLNAQKANEQIIAQAKASGIPGCGNFSTIH